MEKICKNCKLYVPQRGICGVTIMHEGQYLNLPVDSTDYCFYEQEYFDPISNSKDDFNHIQELRVYETNGKVKIQYPDTE